MFIFRSSYTCIIHSYVHTDEVPLLMINKFMIDESRGFIIHRNMLTKNVKLKEKIPHIVLILTHPYIYYKLSCIRPLPQKYLLLFNLSNFPVFGLMT